MTGPNMWILLDPIGSRDNAIDVAQHIIWIEPFGCLKATFGSQAEPAHSPFDAGRAKSSNWRPICRVSFRLFQTWNL